MHEIIRAYSEICLNVALYLPAVQELVSLLKSEGGGPTW
jgi:hypothetical protein